MGHFFCLNMLYVTGICYYVRGKALGIRQGGTTSHCCIVALYVEDGSVREQCLLLGSRPAFSHFSRYQQANWALLVLIPGGWGFVYTRTLWISPMNSPVRLEVSLMATSPPQVFSISVLRLYFPVLELWVEQSLLVHQWLPHQPAAALPDPFHNPPPCWVPQPLP